MADRVRKPLTPPINAAGNYVLYTPFSVPLNVIFECVAIRNFEELAERGINVYTTYYKPFNLDQTIYTEDAAMQAAIITLKGADGSEYYVPNTYIQSYPGDSGIVHHNIVIGLELGLVPSTFTVDFLQPLLVDLIKQHIGVDTETRIGTIPYEGTISHDTFVQMERTRIANIKSYKTIYQQLNETIETNTNLLSQQNDLLTIISDLNASVASYISQLASQRTDFESQLKDANTNIKALNDKIATLNNDKEEQATMILQLQQQIEELKAL